MSFIDWLIMDAVLKVRFVSLNMISVIYFDGEDSCWQRSSSGGEACSLVSNPTHHLQDPWREIIIYSYIHQIYIKSNAIEVHKIWKIIYMSANFRLFLHIPPLLILIFSKTVRGEGGVANAPWIHPWVCDVTCPRSINK